MRAFLFFQKYHNIKQLKLKSSKLFFSSFIPSSFSFVFNKRKRSSKQYTTTKNNENNLCLNSISAMFIREWLTAEVELSG